MTNTEPFKICPDCQSRRPVAELFCENLVNGSPCAWDITLEAILEPEDVGRQAKDAHRTGETKVLVCRNGHPYNEGDLLCLICSDDLSSLDSDVNPEVETDQSNVFSSKTTARQIAGWEVVEEHPTTFTSQQHFVVRRSAETQHFLLTHYRTGCEPDQSVYELLRRFSVEHVPKLYETGHCEGQAYEVSELLSHGSVCDLNFDAGDLETIERFVAEVGQVLRDFSEAGLRHRDIRPETILIRTLQPLDLVISGFGSARLSDLDLEIAAPIETGKYTAPETIMGGISAASDWWGLGMVLLDRITKGRCFSGADDQLFMIHVIAHGVTLPDGLNPRLTTLLRGLLTVDRTERWQWNQVQRWLKGEDVPVSQPASARTASGDGPSIRLDGKSYFNVLQFSLAAARANAWDEACDLLERGAIAGWGRELNLEARTLSALEQLTSRTDISSDFRLAIGLQLLNPSLPIICKEAIVSPAWLLANADMGFNLLSGPVPELLLKFNLQSQTWLLQLAKRLASVRKRADTSGIQLEENQFRFCSVVSSRVHLAALWDERRLLFPDASLPGLSSIMDRRNYTDEDLIILASAAVAQFRPVDEVVSATRALAEERSLEGPTSEYLSGLLRQPRFELYRTLESRTEGFARCGIALVDEWVDNFRIRRRVDIEQLLIILSVPESSWEKPPHQGYLTSLLQHFEKKVSGSVLRGPLVKMTIGKTTPRIDITELALELKDASAILERILGKSERRSSISLEVFENELNPESRLRRLENHSATYRRDTGVNGLCLGFPFIVLNDQPAKRQPRLAPVLLWPIALDSAIGQRDQFAVKFDSVRDEVRLNPALDGLLGTSLAREWREAANTLMMQTAIGVSAAMDAFGLLATVLSRELVPLPGKQAVEKIRHNTLVPAAVLFHVEFVGQSLVEDLRMLPQQSIDKTSLETMLRIGVTHADLSEPLTTDLRFAVAPGDPSQENAVVQAFREKGVVIQGPPGTGKSQTIVNLVADAIGQHKSVLVVCQKLPALDVVRKRLEACGLKDRICMVKDVNGDREPIVREIRDQITSLSSGAVPINFDVSRQRSELQTKILAIEDELNEIHAAGHRPHAAFGRSYAAVIDELLSVKLEHESDIPDVIGLRKLLRNISALSLEQLEESCANVGLLWLSSDFENSPFCEIRDISLDDATLSEFRSCLEGLHSAEENRCRVLQETPNALHVEDSVEAHRWMVSNEPFFGSLSAEDFSGLAAKVACFDDETSARQLIEAIRDLKELHGSQHHACEELPSLRSVLSRCPEDRVRNYAEYCGQLSNQWIASNFHDNHLQQMKDEEFDAKSITAFQECLLHLATAEKHRRTVIRQPFKGKDVAKTADLEQWLQKNGTTFLNIDAGTATRISELYGLFESPPKRKSKGIALLTQVKKYSNCLSKLELSGYSESIGRLVPTISASEIVYWLNAACHLIGRPSLIGRFNPARFLALRHAKRILTQFSIPPNSANIQLLGEAILLEGQVQDIRRDWRPLSGPGDAKMPETMSLIEIQERIESERNDLEVTHQVFAALMTFPIKIRIDAERLNSPDSFRSLVRMAELIVRRSQARTQSLEAIEAVRGWMSEEWYQRAVEIISTMAPATTGVICPITAVCEAVPTLESFCGFRAALRKAGPVVRKIFEVLSPLRDRVKELSGTSSATQVVRAYVLFNGLTYQVDRLKSQLGAIACFPTGTKEELSLALQSLEGIQRIAERFKSCPCLDARRVELISDITATNRFFADLRDGIKQRESIDQSIAKVNGLSAWLSDGWMENSLKILESRRPSEMLSTRLMNALSSLRDFLVFRRRHSGFSELQRRCFTELAKVREFVSCAGSESVGSRMRVVIRREGLLAWKAELEHQSPHLHTKRPELERKIESLRSSLRKLMEIDKKLLTNNFDVIKIEPATRWEGITRLRGPRRVTLREFFQSGTQLGLRSLRPVWLMIPDVVSQVLPRVAGLFDVVVFDEASQMPVEHALPSLFRARTVVVSGDEKQMPPSSFFSTRMESDESESDEEDLSDGELTDQERDAQEEAWNRREIKDCPDLLHLAESVLPRTMLQIHYRSRYRELISFSNAAYYRNELSVPVIHPDKTILEEKPIEFIPVKGIYEKQTNEEEAKRVVEYVEFIWKQPAESRPSIGVVTFNRKQADLIDDLIEMRAEGNRSFRDALVAERSRIDNGEDMSFFVKNVENVQGDERDVIVFSTTFGKNNQGIFRRNFGVLGQSGGERRLNVAITRARNRVALITSMPVHDVSDMLNVQRPPVSPRDYLQGYLEYARLITSGAFEDGRRLASRMNTGKRTIAVNEKPMTGLQKTIFEYLSSLGFEIHRPEPDPVLGIDFAVTDPQTGLFGVGIECDPPNHKLLANARAREIWRTELIGSKYRAFIRVSGSDWLQDCETEQQRIVREIRNVIGEKQ